MAQRADLRSPGIINGMAQNAQDQRVTAMLRSLQFDEVELASGLRRMREEFPTYAGVTDDQLRASAHRFMRLTCRTLQAGKVPAVEEVWEAEKGVIDRLQAGVPIEDIMGGLRISMSLIQERVVAHASEHGVASQQLVQFTGLIWQLGDVMSARGAAVYRQQGLALAVAEQRRRDAWLLALLTGDLNPANVERGFSNYHLDRNGVYVPFCSEPRPEAQLEGLQNRLSQHFRGSVMIILPSAGQLIGILPATPPAVDGHLLAVGPEATVTGLPAAYEVARSVLAAATMRFHEGVHTAASLGWRLAVPRAPAVTEMALKRYLAPLQDSGDFGRQVVAVLHAWLVHDRSIPLTARAMHLHVNTVRYRLARFEELTGSSLTDSDTIVGLAWALHADPADS